jgi:diguanylate cyclase (GGDEF)-like protein
MRMATATSMIISLLAFLFYSGLLGVVVARNGRTRVAQSFLAYLASMIVWSFGSFMLFANTGFMDALFWNRFLVIGSMAMPIAFFAFVRNFLMRDWREWLYTGYILYAATQIANLLGMVIQDAHIVDGEVQNVYGPAIFVTVISWVFFIGFSTISLIHEYRHTTDASYRNRLKYLLVVILLIFIGSLTNATALSVFPVDIGFNVLAAALIAYALFRHQLLDINLVFRTGLLYSIPTVLIGTAYFLIISLALHIFQHLTGLNIFLISLAVAILTALAAQPMRDGIQVWLDRLFYREKFDSSRMVQRVSRAAAETLHLDELTGMILREVTTTLHLPRAAFILRRQESRVFYLGPSLGIEPKPSLYLRSDHPLILALSERNRPVNRHQFDVMPQFRALWKRERAELEALNMELYVPLMAKGELVGIFALGPKLSGLSFSQDEQDTFVTLADQIAITILNAMLFDAEGRRRREAEALQMALAELTSALDLQEVLNGLIGYLDSVIPFDSACVFLLRGDRLLAMAARGFPDPAAVINKSYPLEKDLLFQEIQRTRRPLVIEDVQKDVRYQAYGGSHQTRSWMGLPLIVRGTVIGLLTMDSYTPGTYTNADVVALAQAFANHAAVAVENARLFQVEREQRYLAEALREIGTLLSESLDFDHVLNLLLDQVARLVPYDAANIKLVEDGILRVARWRNYERFGDEAVAAIQNLSWDMPSHPVLRRLVETRAPIILADVTMEPDWPEGPLPTRSWLGVPIVLQERVIAVFSLYKLEPDFYRPEHANLLSIFAGQAALAIQNASLYREVRRLAITDELTGIINRRHLFELGERELNRALRFNRPLCVVMLDLDHFKDINDRYGHAVGDQVLRAVAERCKQNLREFDLVGRYGGEEFVIILPETTLMDSRGITERVRECIAATPIETTAGPQQITVSQGVAALDPQVPNLAALIDRADRAMYAAKHQGRNFVCTYSETPLLG